MLSRSSASIPVLLTILCLACSSEDDGARPTKQVKDKVGRTCTIGESLDATCDQAPKPSVACKSGTSACFQVGSTGDAAGPGAICAACCGGNTSSSVAADCSPITCSADNDCPSPYGRCSNGECRH